LVLTIRQRILFIRERLLQCGFAGDRIGDVVGLADRDEVVRLGRRLARLQGCLGNRLAGNPQAEPQWQRG
jgi:hypothetical protein